MKIAIMIPFYKYVDAAPFQSLIQMLAALHDKGHTYVPILCHGLYVERARTALFKILIEKTEGVDYALFLDSDHIYDVKALETLIEKLEANSLDILSAGYIARNMPDKFAHCRMVDGKPEKINTKDATGLIECDAIGLGFAVMKMDFARKMWALNRPLFVFKMDGFGEDAHFCSIAKEQGHKIFFDADTRVKHMCSLPI